MLKFGKLCKKKIAQMGARVLTGMLAGTLFLIYPITSQAASNNAQAADTGVDSTTEQIDETIIPDIPSVDINTVAEWPQGPSVAAEAAILMEAETGTILYAKNIHKQEYPASCTKILTCLIAAERCAMDEMVYMSHSAVYDTPRGSNHIALDEGEAIPMEEALSAILIRSANEVSFAVGEHISGTTWQDFAPIMNEKAKELGCLNSNFVNPNGLPDENHYTTAYDLATIARYFFDNELLAKLSRTTKLVIPITDTQPDPIIEHTKNQLLPGQKRAYEYLVGSKTGYTDAARNCLVSCAEKDGLKLICVVLRDESPAHYEDTIALFDYGFSNFTTVNVSQSETKYNIDNTGMFYNDNDVFGSSKPLLSLNTDDFIVLPQTASFQDTVSTISYDTEEENQAALITYTWNGVEVGTASIDFVNGEDNTFTFDAPMQPVETETPEETEEEDKPVVFVNILKVLLWIVVIAAVLIVLFLGFLYLRRNPVKLPGRKRRRRRRYRSQSPSYMSVSASLEQRRKYNTRQVGSRHRRRRKRPNRFRDYDF